jgi:hypothetical protein
MHLPNSNQIEVNKLASVFNSTSATYKYYWLLAIIDLLEEGYTKQDKRQLFARMISNSWYTVNYFHVSFGKQDNIQMAVEKILKIEQLTIDEKKQNINLRLERSENKQTILELLHFDKNVPHWFLTPWFPKLPNETDANHKKRIYSDSQSFWNDSLYALHKHFIVINPKWEEYLKSNAKIIKDFCYWNLTLFLQTRNPNVPDIANKLIKPAIRGSLTIPTNKYWKNVFLKLGSIECVFTNQKLYFEEKNFALDHFIPHNFVSHDLIWNLLPIDKSFNSSKSDKLPIFNKHFDKFCELQKIAFEINKQLNAKSKFMEEYLSIFPSIETFDKNKFAETIQPLLTIAHNNGFEYLHD